MARVIAAIGENIGSILFVSALAVMSFGFWLAWPPLGFIAFGGLICLPMLVHRMRGR